MCWGGGGADLVASNLSTYFCYFLPSMVFVGVLIMEYLLTFPYLTLGTKGNFVDFDVDAASLAVLSLAGWLAGCVMHTRAVSRIRGFVTDGTLDLFCGARSPDSMETKNLGLIAWEG